MSGTAPTVVNAEHVYGTGVALDDPAETFHEASRLSPNATAAQAPGLLLLLEGDPALHASVARASRRRSHRPWLELGACRLPETPLASALRDRRSRLGPDRGELALEQLSAVLACGYGSRGRDDGERRYVPSGGALYPLELYVLALAVDDLPGAVYHHDPYCHRLELLREAPDALGELASTLVDPSQAERTAAALLVTAVFWRTRFKYGQRGYRFALLEAGHVAQNVLLAAAALDLPALPVGGFYDRRAEELLGVDGVDESALYVILLGGAAA